MSSELRRLMYTLAVMQRQVWLAEVPMSDECRQVYHASAEREGVESITEPPSALIMAIESSAQCQEITPPKERHSASGPAGIE